MTGETILVTGISAKNKRAAMIKAKQMHPNYAAVACGQTQLPVFIVKLKLKKFRMTKWAAKNQKNMKSQRG